MVKEGRWSSIFMIVGPCLPSFLLLRGLVLPWFLGWCVMKVELVKDACPLRSSSAIYKPQRCDSFLRVHFPIVSCQSRNDAPSKSK